MAADRYYESQKGEAGYGLFFFTAGENWVVRLLALFFGLGIAIGVYYWYSRTSNDVSPDSIAGYSYAIVGTIFLLLAAILYSRRRRLHKGRAVGQLRDSLGWHMFFAVLGTVLLFLHCFGNFNPRTGTYALYGMIALVISGFVGRFLDRLMPRLITAEVHKALTAQGGDRIETISQRLQAIVMHNTQNIRGFMPSEEKAAEKPSRSLVSLSGLAGSGFSPGGASNGSPLHTSWDLAYISLEATPQELGREAGQYRFIPDRKSELARPGALMPGAQEHMLELADVEKALQREQFYRYVIRYWRKVHVALVFLTIGLTIWHLVYAAQLLIPTFMH